jgi:hypothetical protein
MTPISPDNKPKRAQTVTYAYEKTPVQYQTQKTYLGQLYSNQTMNDTSANISFGDLSRSPKKRI